MKKLFTFVFALAAFVAASAQDFQVGENVAAKLGLGDVDGTSFSGTTSASTDNNRPHDLVMETLGNYWKVDGDKPNEFREPTEDCVGIYGFYDKKEADIYQVVKFPAGAYTVDVQALYREGTPADNFTNHFNKKYMKYGHLYADCLSSQDASSAVTRTFDKVLRSLATADQHERLYYYGDGSWMNDYDYESKEVDEEGNKIHYFCPQCLTGLGQYFAADKYHNTMKIVVTEDTYIRLGFRKTGYIQADWLVFTNLQVIYDGPADEAAKIDLAKEEFKASLSNLEDVMNDVIAAGFDGLAGLISDAIMESNDDVDAAKTVDEIVAVKNNVEKQIDEFSGYVQFVKNLGELFKACEVMMRTSDYPGMGDFMSAYDKAVAAAKTSDVDALGDDPAKYFQDIYAELSVARAEYLNSQIPDENGAKDFTPLVTNPWFVNIEYNPTHNSDGTWTLSEGSWGWGNVGNPGAYSDKKSGRTDISSDVVLSPSSDVTNMWYKANKYTGWSSGMALYYQAGLIGVSDGWNSLATGTIGIEQQLVGLPNGYYSLKGLVRGNDGDKAWDGQSREIFAQNSSGEIVVSEIVKNDADRPNSATNKWYEWNPNAWADVETSIIAALDGKLLIGGRCSKVANFTGFRLFFYGESLDFTSKLQEYLDVLQPQVDQLLFAGDKKAVNDLLAQIQFPITDKDAYEVAFGIYNEAKNVYSAAVAGEKNFNAFDVLVGLAEYDFTTPAFDYMSSYGDSSNDTYERVAELNEVANVYKTYCGVYDKAVALHDPTVDAIIASQVAELKQSVKTADEMGAYLDQLALPYNTAIINANGGKEASEAKPANITALVMNADLKEGPKAKWDCVTADPSCNSYGRHLAECWNQDPFTISQTLTSLPAGVYEFRVRALYRDGGAVNQEMIDRFEAANGDYSAWEGHNIVLFANESENYVKSICEGKFTERSFDKWYNAGGGDAANEFKEAGFVQQSYNSNICVLAEEMEHLADWGIDATDADLMNGVTEVTPDTENPEYIFDTQVGDYFFPSSTAGFMYRIQKSPEAYCNSVRVTIEQNGDLKIGFRKDKKVEADWLIYDDFELYYLGADPTAIQSVNANASVDAPSYNVAGQRVADNYKGIVIKNGKKFMNK